MLDCMHCIVNLTVDVTRLLPLLLYKDPTCVRTVVSCSISNTRNFDLCPKWMWKEKKTVHTYRIVFKFSIRTSKNLHTCLCLHRICFFLLIFSFLSIITIIIFIGWCCFFFSFALSAAVLVLLLNSYERYIAQTIPNVYAL